STGDGYLGTEFTEPLDSSVQSPICTGNTTNLVMDVRRPVDRHNDVVHGFNNHLSMLLKQQAGGQECKAHALRSTHSTQGTQIGMHQWFPTREDNPLHLQFPKTGKVRFEVTLRNFSCLSNSPDITHHATTITAAMRKDNQDGKVCDPMLRLAHTETSLPARRTPSDKQTRVSRSNWRTGARTRRLAPPTVNPSKDFLTTDGQRSAISGEKSRGSPKTIASSILRRSVCTSVSAGLRPFHGTAMRSAIAPARIRPLPPLRRRIDAAESVTIE